MNTNSVPAPSQMCSAQLHVGEEMHFAGGSSCGLISHLLWTPRSGHPKGTHPSPLQQGAFYVCPPGFRGWPGPRCSPLPAVLLRAGAGDAGEADAEKLVTAVSKPDHNVRLTHHSPGEVFSLP